MSFLAELFVFLLAALIVVPLLNRAGLSSVIGYLVAGIGIGPSGLGIIGHADEILHFAEIGVVLLLFVIGLELQPRRLWVMRKTVFGLGAAQVVAVTAALSLLCWWVLGLGGTAALVFGFALALSSTAFVLQLLAEKKSLNKPHGRAAFGVLLFQDVAVIPAIVVITALGGAADGGFNAAALLLVVVAVIVARFLLKPMLRYVASTGIHELFIAASLAIVCGAALGMYQAGLSMGLGAFIAGMLVADSEYRHQLETDVMPFKGLLLGLFFIAVGMSANIGLLVSLPATILSLTLALVVLKLVLFLPVLALFGYRGGEGLRTGAVLSQGGEFAFVLLTAALGSELVTQNQVDVAVLVVTLSMASTPFLMMALERVLATGAGSRPFDEPLANEKPRVIVAGFGRFGQIVGRVLTAQDLPFTALDASPGQVDFVRDFGNEVFYGDASRLDMLHTAGAADARALVIAVDDVEASVRMAETLRETFPRLPLLARARNRQHEIRLRDLGVQFVIRDTLLSSLELTRELVNLLGVDASVVDVFQRHDAATLEKQAAVAHDAHAYRQTTRDAAAELRRLFTDDQRSDSP